jgi:hypothetical protein
MVPPLSKHDSPFVLQIDDVPSVAPQLHTSKLLTTVKNLAYGSLIVRYLKKRPEKFELFERLRCTYDAASAYVYRTTALRLVPIQNFAIKVSAGKLKLRSRINAELQDEMRVDTPDEAKVRRLAAKYSTAHCPFGCDAVEDWSHFVHCPFNASDWHKMPQRMVTLVAKYAKQPVTAVPVWYYDRNKLNNEYTHTVPCPETRALREFTAEDGAAGFLPSTLRLWLRKSGVHSADMQRCLHDIQVLILETAHSSWLRRCHKLYGTLD